MFLKEGGFFSTEVFTLSNFHRVFKDDDPMMFIKTNEEEVHVKNNHKQQVGFKNVLYSQNITQLKTTKRC